MPYSAQPAAAFWKLCRDDPEFRISELFQPKFSVSSGDRIATAGSCFAQNISSYIARSGLNLLQMEPAPRGMRPEVARRFGYDLYSARYSNIYTVRQLRQLLEDAAEGRLHDTAIWEREGRFFDALRPGVEPEGLGSEDEVRAHRSDHLRRVSALLAEMDVFIFTLGLTETWEDIATGLVFPAAPGVIAGRFDPDRHRLINQRFDEVREDMQAVIARLRSIRPDLRIILSVSPVPLTATATGRHVLAATTCSKAILHAVVEDLSSSCENLDYFPAYEMIATLPFGGQSFESNLRSVAPAAVDRVMRVFFAAYGAALAGESALQSATRNDMNKAVICEEFLTDAFAPK